ncbi:hypothetical protein K2X40_05000 [Candidatus Babeliales bacterium]|nr:hypothetical protein [Candidatus Babeliales bacterium]
MNNFVKILFLMSMVFYSAHASNGQSVVTLLNDNDNTVLDIIFGEHVISLEPGFHTNLSLAQVQAQGVAVSVTLHGTAYQFDVISDIFTQSDVFKLSVDPGLLGLHVEFSNGGFSFKANDV